MVNAAAHQPPQRQVQDKARPRFSQLPGSAQTEFAGVTQVPAPGFEARLRRTPANIMPGDIAYLQRTIGNQQVAHLLEQRSAQQGARPVGASKVQRQRKTAGESDLASIGPAGGMVDAKTSSQIQRMRGGGKSIDKSIRAPLEQQLNTDLSHVRLHVNAQSDLLNRKVGARAFTTGSDVFVQRNEYKPNSRAGRSLLYHELTHVHQQTGGAPAVQRSGLIQREDNEVEQEQEDFSGVGISGYDNTIAYFTGLYYKTDKSDNKKEKDKKNTKKEKTLDYLRNLKSKPQNKQQRQEQKAEKKQMKNLLHFQKKNTKTTDANQRIAIRAFLVSARAHGASMPELSALKEFFIAFGQQVGSGDYTYMLLENTANVKDTLSFAEQVNASPLVLNFLYRCMPDRVARTDKAVNWLNGQLPKLVEVSLKAGKTETDNSMLRLPAKARQLEKAVNAMVAARDQGRYYEAQHMVSETKVLASVVERMAHYAQMRGKSNLHSENEMGTAKRLGGGQVSKVYEVNYDPQQQPSITHGVFKQENLHYDEGDSPAADASGIEVDSPNFGGRSVATYKADKLFGLGITPKTKFGTHGGEGGTIQDWAKGQSPQSFEEGVGVRYREFDYSDPEIQRQLATLQLFDAITGQVDRHPGNYYIYQGPGGTKVTAIDNDLAFGKNKGLGRVLNPVWQTPLANDQSRGVPLFVDESIAESILKTSSKDFKKTIENLLPPAEVNKSLERFGQVKSELRKKKANSARIKFMQGKVDVMERYAGKFGSSHGNVEEGLNTQINFYKNQMSKLFAQGALIDQSQWGKKTAQYLNSDNSYFGLLVDTYTESKKAGKTIPVK